MRFGRIHRGLRAAKLYHTRNPDHTGQHKARREYQVFEGQRHIRKHKGLSEAIDHH